MTLNFWNCRGKMSYLPLYIKILLYLTLITLIVIITLTSHQIIMNSLKQNNLFWPSFKSNERIYTKDELETTNRLLIDKPRICSNNQKNDSPKHLIMICFSSVYNFEMRKVIRETWGSIVRKRRLTMYFIVGLVHPEWNNRSMIQEMIMAEDAQYNDILQTQFIDSYRNLTLKTIAMMGWLSEYNCTDHDRYVLKVDDDMLVNIDEIDQYAQSNPMPNGRTFIGRLAINWKPFRNPRSKYYCPESIYKGKYYPKFVSGPSYMFTIDAAEPLFKQAKLDSNVFYLEDVYITGILSERLGINRTNHLSFTNIHSYIKRNDSLRHWTSHDWNATQLRSYWKQFLL